MRKKFLGLLVLIGTILNLLVPLLGNADADCGPAIWMQGVATNVTREAWGFAPFQPPYTTVYEKKTFTWRQNYDRHDTSTYIYIPGAWWMYTYALISTSQGGSEMMDKESTHGGGPSGPITTTFSGSGNEHSSRYTTNVWGWRNGVTNDSSSFSQSVTKLWVGPEKQTEETWVTAGVTNVVMNDYFGPPSAGLGEDLPIVSSTLRDGSFNLAWDDTWPYWSIYVYYGHVSGVPDNTSKGTNNTIYKLELSSPKVIDPPDLAELYAILNKQNPTNVNEFIYRRNANILEASSTALLTPGYVKYSLGGVAVRFYVCGNKGEEAEVIYKVSQIPNDGRPPTVVTNSIKAVCTGRAQEVATEVQIAEYDSTVVVQLLNPKSCSLEKCLAGQMKVEVNSVDVQMSLGRSGSGTPAGFIYGITDIPSTNLFTPGFLTAAVTGNGEIVTVSNRLRQVCAEGVFVDIVEINSSKFETRFYNPVGTMKTNGLYSPIGVPFAVNTLEMVGGDTNKLRVTHADSTLTNIWDFEYSQDENGWWLDDGSGRKKFKNSNFDVVTGIRTVTNVVKSASNVVLSKTVSKYMDFGEDYGERIIEQTQDPDGTSKTTTWAYFDDYDFDGAAYGLLKKVIYPTGNWQRYAYDQYGRTTNVVSQFLNGGSDAAENDSRVTQYSYDSFNTTLDALKITTNSPRRTIEKLLGAEISRGYAVYGTNETWKVQCQTPGAAINATDNLFTISKTFTRTNFYGLVQTTLNPDGTMTLVEEPAYSSTTNQVVKSYWGVPNAEGTAITNGTLSITVTGTNGLVLSTASYDIATEIQLSGEVYTYNSDRKVIRVDYLDGAFTASSYDCCTLLSNTERDGSVTSYVYDSLKRQVATVRNGITYSNWFDVDGKLRASYKIAGGTTIVTERNGYDSAGNLVSVTNALGYVTQYAESVDGSGQGVRTTTNPDGGTQIETSYQDGSSKSMMGTTMHGVKFEYGVETVDGVARAYTKQILLETNGTDTAEWVKRYTDMVGRTIKTVYPDGAANRQYFNLKGQLWKTVDPDGVTMLYQYNSKGEQEYTALDMNRNDQIDFAGTDRITQSVREILLTPSIVNLGSNLWVFRSRTYRWEQEGVDIATLVSTSESSVTGKRAWSSMAGLISSSQMVYGSDGWQYVTNTAPDGSFTVLESQYGQMKTMTWWDANHGQLGKQTYLYDRFGRMLAVSDARNGGSATLYDVLDRSVVQAVNLGTVSYNDGSASLSFSGGSLTIDYHDPYAVGGFPTNAQVTTTWLTTNGQPWCIQQPDGSSVTNEYFITGELKRIYGSRTYPVEYAYDYAGRQKSLKTWQDFSGNTGAAVTMWNYSTNRSFILAKRYADNQGPEYEYTVGGRMSKRTWSRGVVTDYSYNNAGDLAGVSYSDGTPGVSYAYDRVGRRITVTQGTQDTVAYSYNDIGQMTKESHAAGLLNGLTVTNGFDLYGRRQMLSVLQNGTNVYKTTYGYDGASRLQTVSQAGQVATYAYHTNSSLVQSITFQKFGVTRLTTVKGYDTMNRLTNIVSTPSGAGESPISYTYQYDAANQRTKVAEYDGSYWEYAYDSLGQVTNGVKKFSNGTAINGMGFGYQYDDIGNRKSTTLQSRPTMRTSSYGANVLNQYTNQTMPGIIDIMGTAHTNAVVTVNGNIATRQSSLFWLELTPNNTNAPVWQVVTNKAVMEGVGSGGRDIVRSNLGGIYLSPMSKLFTYDADGNLTQDDRWAYTWDAENRLLEMQTITGAANSGVKRQKIKFAYNHKGLRIGKSVLNWDGADFINEYTCTYLNDGMSVLIERFNGYFKKAYMHGADELLAIADQTNSNFKFVAIDGVRNVRNLIDAGSGHISASYEYTPEGKLIIGDDTTDSMGFGFKMRDAETGLICIGYRYYSPDAGRWISRDLIHELGGENLYGYAGNDSIGKFDDTGLFSNLASDLKYHSVVTKTLTEFKLKMNKSDIYKAINGPASIDKLLPLVAKMEKVSVNKDFMDDPNGSAAEWKGVFGERWMRLRGISPDETDVFHEAVHAWNTFYNKAVADDGRRDEGMAHVSNNTFERINQYLIPLETDLNTIMDDDAVPNLKVRWTSFWNNFSKPSNMGGNWGGKWIWSKPVNFDLDHQDFNNLKTQIGLGVSCQKIADAFNAIMERRVSCYRFTCGLNEYPPGSTDHKYTIGVLKVMDPIFK